MKYIIYVPHVQGFKLLGG